MNATTTGYWMDPGSRERQEAGAGSTLGLAGAMPRGLLLADGALLRGAPTGGRDEAGGGVSGAAGAGSGAPSLFAAMSSGLGTASIDPPGACGTGDCGALLVAASNG